MKVLQICLITIILLVAAIVFYLICVILLAHFTKYNPDSISDPVVLCLPEKETTELPDSLTLYTWNIGYAGLGKESDFFYDGGKMVRSDLKLVEKNYHGIVQEIITWKDADFILLQEVDWRARRSYDILQAESISKAMKERGFTTAHFASNYDVKWVPMPFDRPMGWVKSGLLSMSKYQPETIKRYSYPGSFPWPKGLFFLNRCFMVARYPYNGKELLVVNTHNSAFDGGTLKKQEMDYLKSFLLEESAKGNYVIVGGDWNQIPPGFKGNPSAGYEEMPVPVDFPAEGWRWVADLSHRSNRKVDTPYVPGKTYTTILDFYLISPNIDVLEIKGLDFDFEYSDHQAIRLKVALK
jgi:endonuclease/exonuclease/phosphatase family metal-dependent hydrolase